jgi:hypothetical protein
MHKNPTTIPASKTPSVATERLKVKSAIQAGALIAYVSLTGQKQGG